MVLYNLLYSLRSYYNLFPILPDFTLSNACLSRLRISCSAFFTVPETLCTVTIHSLPSISLMNVKAAHTIRKWSLAIRTIPVLVAALKYFICNDDNTSPLPWSPKLYEICWRRISVRILGVTLFEGVENGITDVSFG